MAVRVPDEVGAQAPAPSARARPARYLHPLAWWAWALGLMVAASRTTNPLLLTALLACLATVVATRRPEAPWGGAFSTALRLGMLVMALRTLLQVLVGDPLGAHVIGSLPQIALPGWMAGVRLGGLVTWESILVGLAEGLRLATMIACVGAANSLAAPSRLLRTVPAALYELGVALVVALTFAPRMLEDSRRVRAARRLRGHDDGRLSGFVRAGGPVLDGGLERSIQLAAAMDSRGYGRTGTLPARARHIQTALVLAGFAGVLMGMYGLFDTAAPRWLGWPMLALGGALAVGGVHTAGRHSARTTYRPDPWRGPEWLTTAAGVAVAGTFIAMGHHADLTMPITPLAIPRVSVSAIAAILLAAGPAWWTPAPPATGGTA